MDNRDFWHIAAHTTKKYLKAQLIVMSITLALLAVGFFLLQLPLWFLWAFLLTLADLLPVIGVGLFIIPWAIVCFFTGQAAMGGWLLLLYLLQVVIRQIVEPIVVGKNIGLNPLVTFAAAILGSLVLGPWGLVLGPIAAAIYTAYQRRQALDDTIDKDGH